jgi:TRAP-type C4-dicarboxylate transport system permease small subunit
LKRFESSAGLFLRRVGALEKAVTFGAFIILIAVVFADVLSRELTGSGLHWARQAGVYANIFVVMIGIGIASAEGAHLRPRFADGWLPQSWDPVLIRLQEGLMALFCMAFAWVAAGVVLDSYLLSERSAVLQVVIWPVQSIIPLVFLMATIRHGLYGIFPGLRPVEPASGGLSETGQS